MTISTTVPSTTVGTVGVQNLFRQIFASLFSRNVRELNKYTSPLYFLERCEKSLIESCLMTFLPGSFLALLAFFGSLAAAGGVETT